MSPTRILQKKASTSLSPASDAAIAVVSLRRGGDIKRRRETAQVRNAECAKTAPDFCESRRFAIMDARPTSRTHGVLSNRVDPVGHVELQARTWTSAELQPSKMCLSDGGEFWEMMQ